MIKNRNVFICTRPLQYLNLKGIVNDDLTKNYNILFVFANFNQGVEFTNYIIQYEKCWNEVHFINSKLDLLKRVFLLKISNLYLSNDVGYNYLVSLFSFSKNIFVYEEGWATYMTTKEKSNIRVVIQKLIYRLIGSGNHIGNSILTKGVFVYNPTLFKRNFPKYRKQIDTFYNDFIKRIEKEQFFFNELYNYKSEIDFSNKNVLIYATGWNIDHNVIDQIDLIKSQYDVLLLKLHPHIKNPNIASENFQILKQNVMLEFYLQGLLKNNNRITVYHDNSFSVLHFANDIEVINIGRFRIAFNHVEKEFLNQKNN